MEEPKFPLSASWFIEYQEAGACRALGKFEKELLTSWVPVINGAYQVGRDGESIEAMLDRMDQAIEREEDPTVVRIEKSFRWWVCKAWVQGRAGETQERKERTL